MILPKDENRPNQMRRGGPGGDRGARGKGGRRDGKNPKRPTGVAPRPGEPAAFPELGKELDPNAIAAQGVRLAAEDSSTFIEKVIAINRITKVTKGGKRLSFSALVVVGDTMGRVGYSLEDRKSVV